MNTPEEIAEFRAAEDALEENILSAAGLINVLAQLVFETNTAIVADGKHEHECRVFALAVGEVDRLWDTAHRAIHAAKRLQNAADRAIAAAKRSPEAEKPTLPDNPTQLEVAVYLESLTEEERLEKLEKVKRYLADADTRH